MSVSDYCFEIERMKFNQPHKTDGCGDTLIHYKMGPLQVKSLFSVRLFYSSHLLIPSDCHLVGEKQIVGGSCQIIRDSSDPFIPSSSQFFPDIVSLSINLVK